MKSIDSAFAWLRDIRQLTAWGWALGLFLAVHGADAPKVAISDSYRVQPTDVLIIEVVNEPQLSAKEFRVASSGDVSFPFIGALNAAGRTTVEIQTELKALLEADYLVNAQVLVQVKEFRKQQISVFGQVNRPGLIDIPPERRMTVIEAITSAAGFTRLARTSDIQLTRIGRPEPMRFSVEDLRNPDKAVYVEPGDVIFVPESRI
ncbi:MAG: polysaccharide export protein [Verrucomicrobiales bacterium]|nr:polysaccharide export protein [Verrucomicrobiales bacterium]